MKGSSYENPTLQKGINQQRQRAAQQQQDALRTARRDALSHCERWLYELTWATMRASVRKRYEELRQEGQALVQKGAQQSEAEAACLAVVQAAETISTLFLHNITPTARQAASEQSIRWHEQAQRQATAPYLP